MDLVVDLPVQMYSKRQVHGGAAIVPSQGEDVTGLNVLRRRGFAVISIFVDTAGNVKIAPLVAIYGQIQDLRVKTAAHGRGHQLILPFGHAGKVVEAGFIGGHRSDGHSLYDHSGIGHWIAVVIVHMPADRMGRCCGKDNILHGSLVFGDDNLRY